MCYAELSHVMGNFSLLLKSDFSIVLGIWSRETSQRDLLRCVNEGLILKGLLLTQAQHPSCDDLSILSPLMCMCVHLHDCTCTTYVPWPIGGDKRKLDSLELEL